MRRLKTIKVLVNSFVIFSFFSLIDVSAVDKNVEINEKIESSSSESSFNEHNREGERNKEQSEENEAENFEDKNKIVGLEDVSVITNVDDSKNIKTNSQQKDEFVFFGEVEGEISEFEKKFLKMCFFKGFEDVDYNKSFKNIMRCFGYNLPPCEVNSPLALPIFSKLQQDTKKYEKFCSNNEFESNNEFNDVFAVNWLEIIKTYYPYCFKEDLNYFIYLKDKNDIKDEVYDRFIIKDKYFDNFFDNVGDGEKEHFKQSFEKLVMLFLEEVYLKSFFVYRFKERHDFFNLEIKNCFMQFMKIFLKVLKCEFNVDGSLARFDLNFDENLAREEKIFLKRLFYILYYVKNKNICKTKNSNCVSRIKLLISENKTTTLLYNLYMATAAFLQNKDFWNDMFRIIAYINGYCANVGGCAWQKNKIFEKYSNSYNENYEEEVENNKFLENDINTDLENKKYGKEKYLKLFREYDFDNSHERFKKTLLGMFDIYKKFKKGVFYYNKTSNKRFLEEFSDMDEQVKNFLSDYAIQKFPYSIGVKDFSFLEDKNLLKDLFAFENCYVKYGFKDHEIVVRGVYYNYILNKEIINNCLNFAVQNENIKKECIHLIKYMFKYYLTYGFIKLYGNNQYENDVLILKLADYFENILRVEFKNVNGLWGLKLSFKEPMFLNEYTQVFNEIIKKYEIKKDWSNNKNWNDTEKNWKNAKYREKLIYRFFLTANSFINEENFWNSFLSYLIYKKQIKTAEMFPLDERGLSEEYKSLNKTTNFLNNSVSEEMFKNFEEVSKFNRNNFFKVFSDFFYGKDEKRECEIDDRFRKNFKFLAEYMPDKFLFQDIVKDSKIEHCFPDCGARYAKDFSYDDFQSLVFDLLNRGVMYSKNEIVGLYNLCDYKQILKNKTIANECISLIKYFFSYYMLTMTFNGPLRKNYKSIVNLMNADEMDIIKIMFNWYNIIFDVKVVDGEIKFKFKTEYSENNYIVKDIEFLIKGLNKTMEGLVEYEHLVYESDVDKVLKDLLHNMALDALAFLNSEGFWNNFMADVLCRKLIEIKSRKENFVFADDSLNLNKELLEVLKEIE